VRPGETLYALSRQYGVTVDELRSWNRLGDATIRVGQTLVVGR
jgi:membrane-bound lytic murein transglycosylase D